MPTSGTDGDRTSTLTYSGWYPIPPVLPLASNRVRSKVDMNRILAQTRQGQSLRQVAAECSVSHETIRQRLKGSGRTVA